MSIQDMLRSALPTHFSSRKKVKRSRNRNSSPIKFEHLEKRQLLAVFGEIGSATAGQVDNTIWHEVSFSEKLDDPVIVMGALSTNGRHQSTVRVRNVNEDGFQWQIDEWDYLDGAHTVESIDWMAIERGLHTLDDGTTFVADSVNINHLHTDVSLEAFAEAPVVFATQTTNNGGQATATRMRAVSSSGFQIQLAEEERNDGLHAVERVDYIAVEAGVGDLLHAAITPDAVTHGNYTIDIDASVPANPAFFAQMQTTTGGDPATTRIRSRDDGNVTIFIEEEQSGDAEVWHTTESVGFLAIPTGQLESEAAESDQLVRINANMLVDDPQEILDIAQRTADSGGTGIVLADSKLTNYWNQSFAEDYVNRVNTIVDGIRALGLDVHLTVRGLGYSGTYLAVNQNLATGYPVEATPLTVQGNQLIPVETATVIDGGFEETSDSNSNVPFNARFQDAPGERTFVDTEVKRTGESSFRADAVDGKSSRLFTTVDVLPWQQYTLNVWVKTDSLSASNWTILVRDMDTKVSRTSQKLSEARDSGGRRYFNRVEDYTTDDWTQLALSFNSADSTELDITFAVFGGTSGSVWWDDFSVDATPTMNWLQRDSLPVQLTSDGVTLEEGVDVVPISDPLLGKSRFAGTYDNYHTVPGIQLTEAGASQLNDGDTVYLDGYHTMVAFSGQAGMSWHDPEVFALRSRAVEEVWSTFKPEGIVIGDNEIRLGGAEPLDQAFGSAGAAIAAHFETVLDDVTEITDGKAELFMWSDMFDPNQNAKSGFQQVVGDLAGSWEGLDPNTVTMLPWRSRSATPESYADTVNHFADRGFDMVVAGYYDRDIEEDELTWRNATEGVDSVRGSMYTTWTSNFSDIEEFSRVWRW